MSLEQKQLTLMPRSFYQCDPRVVAQMLLGKLLLRNYDGACMSGFIVEVEAYLAAEDPASHNYIGKTNRNEVLFGEAGCAYIHSMRQYCLVDVVTGAVNEPGSVLIRALEPVEGMREMMINRKNDDSAKLLNGPGKICQAMQIDRSLNGVDCTSPNSPIMIADTEKALSGELICASPRIGISKATDFMLRYYIKDNPYVSSAR